MRIFSNLTKKLEFLGSFIIGELAGQSKISADKNKDLNFLKRRNWENAAAKWADYASPWRPSKNDLENYSRALSVLNKSCRILILGATPELRDLVVSFGLKPVVVDFSLPMLVEMLRYTKKTNADNEIWVKSDWLEAPLGGNFDAVLGDLVLRFIEEVKKEEFLNKIKSILSPKGVFITRIHFIDESLSELTDEEILNKSIEFLDEKAAASVITGRIFDKFSDPTGKIFYYEKAIEFAKRATDTAKKSEEEKILSRVLEFVGGGMGWPIRGKEFTCSVNSKNELENLFSKFFNIADVRIAGDYPDSQFYPIYILKKHA